MAIDITASPGPGPLGPLPNTCPPPQTRSSETRTQLPQPWGRRRNFLLRQEIALGPGVSGRCRAGKAFNPLPHSVDHPGGYPGDCSPVWGSWRKDLTDPPRPSHDAGDRTVAADCPSSAHSAGVCRGHTARGPHGQGPPSSAWDAWSKDPRGPRALGTDCGLLNPSPYQHMPGWGLQGYTWVGAPQTGELLEERPHRSQGA